MSKRTLCVVLGLLTAATGAQADWQPEPPPVPPDTEDAQRNRAEPAARSSEPAPARAEPAARSSKPAPQNPQPAARSSEPAPARAEPAAHGGDGDASRRLPARVAPVAEGSAPGTAGQAVTSTAQFLATDQPSATPPPGGVPPSAATRVGATAAPLKSVDPRARTDADALRAFPPAPAPAVPGAAPEKPNTALTSFAPAPAPGIQSAQPSGVSGAQTAATASGSAGAQTAATASGSAGAQTTPSGSVGAQTAATASGSAGAQTTPSGSAAAPSAADSVQTAAAASGGPSVQTTPSGSTDELAAVSREERRPEVWSAAALFGIGATFDKTVAGVNPMGFGFGVRADYRILPDWAIGARMLYFVGGSVELPSDDVAMQSWLLAAEAAYAWELDPVSIEPGLAMGLYVRETNYRGYASFTDEPTLTLPDSTRLFFYLAPGVNVSVPLSVATPALAPLSVGADVRLDLAFGKRVTSNIQLLLQVGLRF